MTSTSLPGTHPLAAAQSWSVFSPVLLAAVSLGTTALFAQDYYSELIKSCIDAGGVVSVNPDGKYGGCLWDPGWDETSSKRSPQPQLPGGAMRRRNGVPATSSRRETAP